MDTEGGCRGVRKHVEWAGLALATHRRRILTTSSDKKMQQMLCSEKFSVSLYPEGLSSHATLLLQGGLMRTFSQVTHIDKHLMACGGYAPQTGPTSGALEHDTCLDHCMQPHRLKIFATHPQRLVNRPRLPTIERGSTRLRLMYTCNRAPRGSSHSRTTQNLALELFQQQTQATTRVEGGLFHVSCVTSFSSTYDVRSREYFFPSLVFS